MVTLLNAFLIPLTVIGNVFVLAAIIKTPSLRSPSSTVFLFGQYNCLRSSCWFGCTTDLHWIQTQPRSSITTRIQHPFLFRLRCFSLYDDSDKRGQVFISNSPTIPESDDREASNIGINKYLVHCDDNVMSQSMEPNLRQPSLCPCNYHLCHDFYCCVNQNLSNCSQTSATDSYSTADSASCNC